MFNAELALNAENSSTFNLFNTIYIIITLCSCSIVYILNTAFDTCNLSSLLLLWCVLSDVVRIQFTLGGDQIVKL